MKIIIDVETDIELQPVETQQLKEFVTRLGFKVNEITEVVD